MKISNKLRKRPSLFEKCKHFRINFTRRSLFTKCKHLNSEEKNTIYEQRIVLFEIDRLF